MEYQAIIWILSLSLISTTIKGVTIDLSGCGTSKGCATIPSNCDAADCDMAVTWVATGGSLIDFELAGTGNPGWIGVGFSNDQMMHDTSVITCQTDNSNNVDVAYSYNQGYANQPLSTTQGLTLISGSSSGGELKCSFSREKTVTGTPDDDKIFDLDGISYHIMLAAGSVSGSNRNPHSSIPGVTSDKLDLTSTGVGGASADDPTDSYKAHGCLMIIAWILFGGTGMMIARYYKQAWGGKKFMGADVWFPIHRMCMVMTVLLGAAAFIIIFVEKEEFSDYENWQPESTRAHPFLGIIVTSLSIINPIMAMCRPAPDAENRFIFNWAHWAFGTAAYIMAVVTIFLGFDLPSAESITPDGDELLWLMVTYVVFHVVIELILELYKCSKTGAGSKGNSMEMLDVNGEQRPASKEAESATFIRSILAIYIIGVTGLVAAIVILIAIE